MPMVPKCILSATLLLTFGASAPAYPQTLRPLETESATLLPSGSTQVTLGTTYLRNRRFPAFTAPDYLDSQDLVSAPELEIRIGAGDWVEIQVRYELLYLDENRIDGTESNQFGGGDAEIFTKVRFVREGEIMPALGAIFGVKLPNAASEDRLGTDETDFEIAILASKDFGPATAHLNLGIQILGNPGKLNGDPAATGSGQDDPFVWSLAVVSQPILHDRTAAYAVRALASFDGRAASRFDNDLTVFNGGLQVTRAAWTFYGGGSAGLAGAAEDYGLRFGLTYAFELDRLVGWFRGASTPASVGTSSATDSTISRP